MTYQQSHRRRRGIALTSLTLRNFKSARDADIPLAGITLLVGENSSGKSSVLQALQLIRQAAISDTPGHNFPLNGTLIRMGTINELRSSGARSRDPVSIGVTIEMLSRGPWFRDAGFWVPRPDGAPPMAETLTASWSVDLTGTAQDEPGSTRIKQLQFSVEGSEENQNSRVTLTHRNRRTSEDSSFRDMMDTMIRVSRVNPEYRPRRGLGGIDLDFAGSISSSAARSKRLAGAVVRGGFPVSFVAKRDPGPILARAWVEAARDSEDPRQQSLFPDKRVGTTRVTTEEEFVILGVESLRAVMTSDIKHLRGQEIVVPILRGAMIEGINQPGAVDRLAKRIAAELPEREKVPVSLEDARAELVGDMARSAAEFFRTGVRYLGPLRAEPQVVMPTSPTARTGDIGSRGEFTAAVLRANGRQHIQNPLPDGGFENTTLLDAVNFWAHELGLVDSLTPGDLGAIGLTISVRPAGLGKDLPLTSVGVGVSQLLPVLVLCLLSERRDVLLIEQPELHLHPAMQQRLTDFLLAIARSGRQLIVETHSEYIVSRLRRRIAEDQTDAVLDLVNIVFAERSEDTGDTTYRLVNPSPLGSFKDWPAGFFDQAALEEMEILRLAEDKRSRRLEEE